MNIKNFPKRLDSKTSCMRIKVPENLELALESLIRKVLREQPADDDIYAFAANYFETLLCLRDKPEKKEKLNEINQKVNEEERNEMIILANSFPKPSPNMFTCSPVRNKEKKRKNSASKLVKLNDFEEKENIKENIKPKASLIKTKLEDVGERKEETNDNISLKNSSDGNVSNILQTTGLGTERVLSTLNMKGDLKKNNKAIIQYDVEVEPTTEKEKNTNIENKKEFLTSDSVGESVKQELIENVTERIASNNELIHQERIKDEIENNVIQVEETESVYEYTDGNNSDEEIRLRKITKDKNDTIEIYKNEAEEEIVEEKIKNKDVLLEKNNEKPIKKDENKDVIVDVKDVSVDAKTSQLLKNDENTEEGEKINLQNKENAQQAIENQTQLIEENNSETSEELDQRKKEEVISNNEIDNKIYNDVLGEKDTETVNTDDINELEEKLPSETLNTLKEPDITIKNETEKPNDSIMFEEKKEKKIDESIDGLLESCKEENEFQTEEMENKIEKKLEIISRLEENENEKKEEIEEKISIQSQNLSETEKKINVETGITTDAKNVTKTAMENSKGNMNEQKNNKNKKENTTEDEAQNLQKSILNLEEAAEEKEKSCIEDNNSKGLYITKKDEEENLRNEKITKKESIEENEHQSLKDESTVEEFFKLPEAKETVVKKAEKTADDSSIIDTNLDLEKLEIISFEEKKLADEISEEAKNQSNFNNETSTEKTENTTTLDGDLLNITDDTSTENENKINGNILENKTSSLVDLPLQTSVDNIVENKVEICESGALVEEQTPIRQNEIESETSIKDEHYDQNISSKILETELQNFRQPESGEQNTNLESYENIKSKKEISFVEENSSNKFDDNEKFKKINNEKNLADAKEDSEKTQLKQIAAVKTEQNILEENEHFLQKKDEKSEAINISKKDLETEYTQVIEEKEVEKDFAKNKSKSEIDTTEPIKALEQKNNKTTSAESSNQFETPKMRRWSTIDTDTETIYEDSNKSILLEEAFNSENESSLVEKNEERKVEDNSKSHNFPEELCSVVDINEINRAQEQKELCTVVDKIQIIPVEEKVNGTEETLPEEEIMSMKTIKTHYYDLLKVPETNIKEYRIKPLKEDDNFLSPWKSTHSIITTYQFEKETLGKELWTLTENAGTSSNDIENKLDDQRIEIDELMTPSSVTSMAVSEMSIFSINETFLDSERLYSEFDKRFHPSDQEGKNQTEGDNGKKGKKEIEEVIEKKTVGRSVAVPMPPRDSDETIEEANEESKNVKVLKEKSKKNKGSLSKKIDGSSTNDKSTDSENFAFFSVDIETVIGAQKIDDDENEDLEGSKISNEIDFVEIETETTINVVQERTDQGNNIKISEQVTNGKKSPQSIQKINDKELSLIGTEQIDSDQYSLETTETTNSSDLTEIKRFNSTKKNLTRSSTQNLLSSQSLDKSIKIQISENFVKRQKFVRTKSLNSLNEEIIDKDIWKKIENELQEAATKIQAQFRSYRKKKKLQRGDAIQITSESPRSTTPLEAEVEHQQASGELHDSIVLPVIPR